MAYGVVHHFPGATEEQYQAALAAVHPSDGSLPEGQVLHIGGKTPEGWVVIAVHDSKESWEGFRDNTLMPALQAGIEGGPERPPQEIAFEVKHQVSG